MLEDPLTTNALRGEIHFRHGDVESGVGAWGRVEATFRRLFWVNGHCTEVHSPRTVVGDPRYQALLEELGIGRTWRE